MKKHIGLERKWSIKGWYENKQMEKYFFNECWYDFIMEDSADFIDYLIEKKGMKIVKEYIKIQQEHYDAFINGDNDNVPLFRGYGDK